MIDRRRVLALYLLLLDARRALAQMAKGERRELRAELRPPESSIKSSDQTRNRADRQHSRPDSSPKTRLNDRERRGTGSVRSAEGKDRGQKTGAARILHAIDLSRGIVLPDDQIKSHKIDYLPIEQWHAQRAQELAARRKAEKPTRLITGAIPLARAVVAAGPLGIGAAAVASSPVAIVGAGAATGYALMYHSRGADELMHWHASIGVSISGAEAWRRELDRSLVKPARDLVIRPVGHFLSEATSASVRASDRAGDEISRRLAPAAEWFNRGVHDWMRRQH